MANKIEFKRGDAVTHYFQYPADSWSAGGTLSFIAKPSVDNDATDAAAVIDKSFTDADIVDESHEMYSADYKTYELVFEPEDISSSVTFDSDTTKQTYLGEYQYIPSGGDPESFPGNDQFFDVVIYADLRRSVS